jgi:hypothetical protein
MVTRHNLAWATLAAALLSACAVETSETNEEVTLVKSSLAAQDPLYFRCNATGWDVNDATRVKPTADPYVFSLVYDVTQPWMVSNGDSCVLTQTNQLNGWGTAQAYFGAVHGAVNAPGGDLLSSSSSQIAIRYPALGRYKVTVNWMQGSFMVEAASPAETWNPCRSGALTTFAQSPQSPASVIAGCGNGDLYITYYGLSAQPSWTKHDTWTLNGVTSGLPDAPINSIVFSPTATKTVYLAMAGSKQGSKLWKSTTGGVTWVQQQTAPLAEIWSVSVNPLDTQKVYVAGPGGVFMSPDGGATWTADVTAAPLNVPLASGAKLSTVSIIGNDPDRVWAGATNGDIFYTTNARTAQTWTQATHGMPARMVTRVSGYKNPDHYAPTIYATFDGLYNDSVWVTSNNGFGWALLHTPPLPTSPMPLPGIYGFYGVSVNPVVNTTVYINGTYGAGVSTSGGALWTWSSN